MNIVNGVTHMESVDWLNDRGLAYGDGLFETLAVINQSIQHWPLHWQRLLEGCLRLKLTPPDEKALLSQIQQVIDNTPCVVKVVLTRKPSGRGYKPRSSDTNVYISSGEYPDYPQDYYLDGISSCFCDTRLSSQPLLAGIKHLNRLEQVMARGEWDNEFEEGLMCTADDNVIEGTMSNLFWVTEGKLYTPPLEQCGVKGTQRQHIVQLAETLNIAFAEKPVNKTELLSQDELFVCNTLIGIWPITQLSQHRFEIGPVTRQLMHSINPPLNRPVATA